MPQDSTSNRRLKFSLLCLLACLALFLTWYNGIAPALSTGMVDFNTLYAGAHYFVNGENPYFADFLPDILGAHAKAGFGVQVTLPSAFGVLAPLTLIEHSVARYVWLAINLVAIVLVIVLALRLADVRLMSLNGFLLIDAILLLGAFRMTLRQGQVDIIILLLVMIAALLTWRATHRLIGGVLLGIAIALKPTNVGLVSIYLLLRGRFVVSVLALFLSGSIVVVCAVYLTYTAPEWFQSWRDVVALPVNDFNRVVSSNQRLDLLTHLEAGLFKATGSKMIAAVLGYLLCGIVLVRTLFSQPLTQSDDPRESYLRELSIVTLVSLLIVYHRFYSGVALVFPLVWAVYLINQRRAGVRVWIVLYIVPLMTIVNGQAAYHALIKSQMLPLLTGSTYIEQVIFGFHYVWLQVGILILLLIDHLHKTRFCLFPVSIKGWSLSRVQLRIQS